MEWVQHNIRMRTTHNNKHNNAVACLSDCLCCVLLFLIVAPGFVYGGYLYTGGGATAVNLGTPSSQFVTIKVPCKQ